MNVFEELNIITRSLSIGYISHKTVVEEHLGQLLAKCEKLYNDYTCLNRQSVLAIHVLNQLKFSYEAFEIELEAAYFRETE